jgi:hypothetical protein
MYGVSPVKWFTCVHYGPGGSVTGSRVLRSVAALILSLTVTNYILGQQDRRGREIERSLNFTILRDFIFRSMCFVGVNCLISTHSVVSLLSFFFFFSRGEGAVQEEGHLTL